MAFQYPASKFEYLRDIGKGTPFAIVHRLIGKSLGLKTALLIAELEWGFSRHEHSTAKNAQYGMPRYIMTPQKQNKYVPVLADKCSYASARGFKSQFSLVGEYYPTLTDYFDAVSSGVDPFNNKPYVCIYNRKKHYARFMRNPLNAKRFFVDRLNGKPLLRVVQEDKSDPKLHVVHEMPLSSSSNTINNVITVDFNKNNKLINESSITKKEEVLADSFAGSVGFSPETVGGVGKSKSKSTLTNCDSVFTVNMKGSAVDAAKNIEVNCKDAAVAIHETKQQSKPPKSAAKLGAMYSAAETQGKFITKTPVAGLDASAQSFNSAKQAPKINAGVVYSAWAKATLDKHPETLLKPPTIADLSICKKIISNTKIHFEEADVLDVLLACFAAWEKGIIQAVMQKNTTMFTFPARLSLGFLLKHQSHFLTWYNDSQIKQASIRENNKKKALNTNSPVVSTEAGCVVVDSHVVTECSVYAESSAGVTFPLGHYKVYPSKAYLKTFEYLLAKAEHGANPSTVGKVKLLKENLAKHTLDLEASLAKVEEYKAQLAATV